MDTKRPPTVLKRVVVVAVQRFWCRIVRVSCSDDNDDGNPRQKGEKNLPKKIFGAWPGLIEGTKEHYHTTITVRRESPEENQSIVHSIKRGGPSNLPPPPSYRECVILCT